MSLFKKEITVFNFDNSVIELFIDDLLVLETDFIGFEEYYYFMYESENYKGLIKSLNNNTQIFYIFDIEDTCLFKTNVKIF